MIQMNAESCGCGVYSRATFINIFDLKCGAYSRAAFNRTNTVSQSEGRMTKVPCLFE